MKSSYWMQESHSIKKVMPGLLLFATLWLLLMLTPNQAFAQAAPNDVDNAQVPPATARFFSVLR